MKVLLLCLLIFVACSKDKPKGKYCFHCVFGIGAGGYTRPAFDTCCDDNPRGDFQFKDGRGNDLTSQCTPK